MSFIRFSWLIVALIFSQFLDAQIFQRSETFAGLGGLAKNNGVAVADYDGDNDLDIFVVAMVKENLAFPTTISRLFKNNDNGTFTDVTEQAGLTGLLTEEEPGNSFAGLAGFKFGVFWGDFNNDGYPDLFFTHMHKIQLFKNLGNGTFQEITEAAGIISQNNCRNTGAVWFDYNNDSFLDLFVSDWDGCGNNTLFRNNGNETFTDVTENTQILAIDDYPSYTVFPFDFNSDTFMDLFVANDFEDPNHVLLNQNGNQFEDIAEDIGLDSQIDDMGIAISDFDRDGDFDYFITGIDVNVLFKNNGNNQFNETGQDHNIQGTGWAWGAKFGDFDLDGDDDLFIVNGFNFDNRGTEKNLYYENQSAQGANTFVETTETMGLFEDTISVEPADFDYDNDGDLDLFVTNSNGDSFLYENKLLNFNETSDLRWFKVMLQGVVSNRDAIGTTLTLETSEGNLSRYYSGVGFLSQSLQAVHFGLEPNANIISLTIKWPSGIEEVHNNLDINTTIRATETQGYEVLNIIPSQKVMGCLDPESCSYNPEATVDDGSCTYLDSSFIEGPNSSGFFQIEVYSYSVEEGSTVDWIVSGGEIVSGQGTNEITVRWHLEENGIVEAREFNGECYGNSASFNVNLNINELPSDKSIARVWNEALLEAIRGDYARPTVHARNLFHTSVAMYDVWAIYDLKAEPYFVGNDVHGYTSELMEFTPNESVEISRKKAISYAVYRLMSHRFQDSPGAEETQARIDLIMNQLGYDVESTTSIDYLSGDAAALGNYVAETLISYGLQDGSREISGYDNAHYEPVNEAFNPAQSDIPFDIDPNRWQPLSLNGFVDQSGNLIEGDVIDFLSPEWGDVNGFALKDEDASSYERDGNNYRVYHDPLEPPYIDIGAETEPGLAYKWGFSMVSIWQSHLDPNDGVLWDISPKSIGNISITDFPSNYLQYPDFYNYFEGGDISNGRALNPVTGQAYEEQMVPRGDYGRVLAEFWADGPDSETPPGHWFTILNYVSDNPSFEKRFAGVGEPLDPLEWDVKSYFTLAGAMHDAAISAWSIKGWYDYIRPVSAIRYMESRGQSTDETEFNYHVAGLPLIDGYIEIIQDGDPLAGQFNQNVGRIKLYTWKGHDYIEDTETDVAGVGWILAQDWWPYQRPNFVTPPFAGYVSGHSTYSRAAAEVMTRITGDEFFPDGMGEFVAKQNEFLVFEDGPSVDVKLQWATYRDASDQCSLSRIWGGIHPPADDIPGRLIGEQVGIDAYNFAVPYFNSDEVIVFPTETLIYPNPVVNKTVNVSNTSVNDVFELFDIRGRKVEILSRSYNDISKITLLQFPLTTASGLYMLSVNNEATMIVIKDL